MNSRKEAQAAEKTERRPRNATATKSRILEAAMSEFAENGFSGARIDAIAQRADCNIRMLYHYFGSKEDLYLLVLEETYSDIRRREGLLNLDRLGPEEAMLKLIDFTYGYFASRPDVVSLWAGENLLRGRFVSTSKKAAESTSPLLEAITLTLKRGADAGVFRPSLDALQIYVSIVALSYFHISNAYTLSAIFSTNLRGRQWIADRKRHATEMLARYLLQAEGGPSAEFSRADEPSAPEPAKLRAAPAARVRRPRTAPRGAPRRT